MAKVKLKTNRGAAKRFKKTGTGGYKHRQSFRNHRSTHKSGKRVRQLRTMNMVSDSDVASIQQLLPN